VARPVAAPGVMRVDVAFARRAARTDALNLSSPSPI
jgi:hypothetical protein